MSIKAIMVLIVGTASCLLLAFSAGVQVTTFALTPLIIVCFYYLAQKIMALPRLREELHRIRTAYEQLDEQAKLVIHSDKALLQRIDKSSSELHRTKDELDRRLASLLSLYELGQRLQVSLRPEEVFARLDARVVNNFGFSKGLLGMFDSDGSLQWRSIVGVDASQAEALRAHLTGGALLKKTLEHPAPSILTTRTTSNPAQMRLLQLMAVPSIVIAGIKPHTGPSGFLILGRSISGTMSARADKELVAILVNQLGAAVENSKLFDESWQAQQSLEGKVRERTSELAAANTKLVELNNAKSSFVSAVSHELRTPLAAIKGYASLLARGQFGELQKAQSERIARIERQSDSLTLLINNLLDIARIESGRTTMEHETIKTNRFLGDIADLVNPQINAKHLNLTMDHDGVKELTGDPQQLQRVFVNLLSNAIKYTPEHGKIELSLQKQGKDVIVTVKDSGCGISAEDLPKLFQEFYRSKDNVNQEVQGTGLGLALVKRIVEAHQGTITVSSQLKHGSTFTVQLPQQKP